MTIKFFRTQKQNSGLKLRRKYKATKLVARHIVVPELFQHKPLKAMLALLLVITILTNIFQPDPRQPSVFGATYTFSQTDWSGGASTTASASHTTDQNNWNKYYSASDLQASSTMVLATTSAFASARTDLTSDWSKLVAVSTDSRTKIAVCTSTGVAHVVYESYEYNQSYINIAYRSSTNWGNRVDLTTLTTTSASSPSIVLDSACNVYVAYYSYEYFASQYNIALRSSTNWSNRVNVTANTASSSYNPSIALDSANNIHVAYYSKEFNPSYNNVAYRSSTDNWANRINVTANTATTSKYPSIAVDASGNIHIAYYSNELNTTYYNIAYRSSTNWANRADVTATTTVTILTAITGPSVAVDTLGNAYVAYYSYEFAASPYWNIALRSSTNWTNRLNVTTNTTRMSMVFSIALDSANNIHIVYHSTELNSGYYNIAYRSSTNWANRADVTTGTAVYSSSYPSAVVASNGTVYTAYYSQELNSNLGTSAQYNIAYRSSANWGSRTDVTTFSPVSYGYSQIAVDSDGTAYAVYTSYEYSSSTLNVALRSSSNWNTRVDVTTSTNTTTAISSPVIAIDAAGAVHVAYYSKEYNSGKYNIAYRSSTNWGDRTDVTASTTRDSYYPSIAIDASGIVHIAYHSLELSASYTNIAYRSSTNWGNRTNVTAASTATSSLNPSIAVDATGIVHIAYQSYETSLSYQNYAYRSSTNWANRADVTATTTVAILASGLAPSLAVDTSGNPHIVYVSKEFNSSQYNVAYRSSTNWANRFGITTTTNGVGSLTSPPLVVDSANMIHVAYNSLELNSARYNIAYRNSGNWNSRVDITTTTGSSAGHLQYPSMAMAIGKAHIAYTSLEYSLTFSNIAYRSYQPAGYLGSGNLVSSPYNTVDSSNVMGQLIWDETLPSGTGVTMSVRTASTSDLLSSASWTGLTNSSSGCSKASNTVTCSSSAFPSGMKDTQGDQWFQYKVALSSSNFLNSPFADNVQVKYVVNATPEIQSVTTTQNSDGTVTISYQVRDADTDTGTINPGYVSTTFQYCANATTTGCVSITAFPAGTGINIAVATSTWTTYTATWTPRGDLSATNDANAVIKITANDNEAANNTVSSSSASFVLDASPPSGGSIVVNASSSPTGSALLTLNASDTSTIYMKISTSSSLTGADWQAYATTSSISLTTFPATVYVQFQDAYSNTTTIYSATTPNYPLGVMTQDISNVKEGLTEYRLFVAWKTITEPTPGFGSYKLYRTTSTDDTNWSLITTIGSRTTNFYTDDGLTISTTYYYKLLSTDAASNTSRFSATVNGTPNGVQDSGEGGGATAVAAQPTISNVATSSVSQNSITITWDTDILSNSKVGYSTATGTFTTEVTVPTMLDTAASMGQHSIVLSGLTPSTTYYFKVYSTNVDSILTSSTPDANGYSFSTLNGAVISNISNPEIYNTKAKVTWDTDQNASEYVVYSSSSLFTSSVATGTAGPYNTHSIILTNLTPSTRYYYYVESNYNSVTSSDKNVISGIVEYYSFSTTYDTTGPTISSITSTPSATTTIITWTTSESADTQILYGLTTAYGSTTTLDSTLTTQHIVTLSGIASSTLYHYKIRATDANSNLTQSTDQTFTTLAAPDTVAPIISNVATSSISLTGATISWQTDEQSNYAVDYGTNSTTYSLITGDLSDYTTTTHSATLASLSGSTTYYFRVRSQDTAGNTATSSQYNFVTVADTAAPTISAVTTAVVNDTSAVITWNTSESADSKVEYGTATSTLSSSVSTSTLGTAHAITLTGLTKETTYYFRVISKDSSNNSATDNNSGLFYSLLTTAVPTTIVTTTVTIIEYRGGGGGGESVDRNAPVITNLTVSTVTPYSATFNWITNEPAGSLIEYGNAATYGNIFGNHTERVTGHLVKLDSLSPAKNYHFRAVSYDSSGNMGYSPDGVFTTLNIDGTPATSTTSTEESAESTKNKYLIATIKEASKDLLSQIFDTLALNPYLPDVSESAFIKAISEMTSKVVDPPVIVGVKPTVEVQGTNAIIRWSTDKNASSLALYSRASEYWPNLPMPYSDAAANPSEFSTSHKVELSNLDPGTTYHYQVQSKGLIGQEAKSGDYTFITQSELPVISDIRIKRVKDSAVNISWKTNIPTASNLEYMNLRTNQTLTQGDNALLLNHTLDLKSLEGGTNYTLVIRGKDEFGNEALSAPIKFSTSEDTGAPEISKLSSVSTLYPGQESKVQTIISWETDEPATSQVFYQEGVNKESPIVTLPYDQALNTRHIVVVTKFKPGAVYRFWVESKDYSENLARSEVFSVLTPQEKETILDIIIKNFEAVFGWTKKIGI